MNAENDVELLWDRERDWNKEFWRVLEDEYSIDRDKLSKNLYEKISKKIDEYLNKDDNFNEFNPNDWQTFKDNFYCKFCPEIAKFIKAEMQVENQKNLKLADFVERNYLEGAEKLLKDGANPNTLTYAYSKKSSLLMRACSIGNYNMAKLLIEYGADVNLRVSLDDNIFKNCSRTAIHESSRDFNLTKLLIDKGANVNAKDMDGKTALHLLIYYGIKDSAEMLKIAKFLIDNGAKINTKDNYGNTLLDNVKNLAANPCDKNKEKIENDVKELKNYLIQKGAKTGEEIKIRPKSNEKLHKACKKQVERESGMGM